MGKKQSRSAKYQLLLTKNIAVDLGTTTTQVYVQRKGVVIQEASVVALDIRNKSILAVGEKARKMLGKTPRQIRVVTPLQGGVIANFEMAKRMLNHFIGQAGGHSPFFRLRVIMVVPFGTTPIEKRAVIEAGRAAGAREVYLIEEPLAAAMGAGLNIEDSKGHLLINLGGGATEVAAIALGGIVQGKSLRSGGKNLDAALQRYLHNKYHLEIGASTAELVKHEAVYACNPPPGRTQALRGRNLQDGLPASIDVPLSKLTDAIQAHLNTIVLAIKKVFEETPPQLASDIIKEGIYLTGGGALLKKIDQFLAQLHLEVQIVANPGTSAVYGAGKVLDQLHTLRYLELYHTTS